MTPPLKAPPPAATMDAGMQKLLSWHHLIHLLAGAALVVAVLAYGLGAEGSTLLGPAIVRMERDSEVSLTFDDGPSPDTARILDVLREKEVRATFFLCGANVERYPALARRIVAEGHELGNHTWSHRYLHLRTRADIADEIDRTQDSIERVTGVRPAYFRPPHGVRWFPLWDVLAERRMTLVLWNSFPQEGASPARDIVARARKRLKPGAIILLHDAKETLPAGRNGRASTVEALPEIIEAARGAGYRFAPLSRARRPAA